MAHINAKKRSASSAALGGGSRGKKEVTFVELGRGSAVGTKKLGGLGNG